jgi:hypothetical protein
VRRSYTVLSKNEVWFSDRRGGEKMRERIDTWEECFEMSMLDRGAILSRPEGAVWIIWVYIGMFIKE